MFDVIDAYTFLGVTKKIEKTNKLIFSQNDVNTNTRSTENIK